MGIWKRKCYKETDWRELAKDIMGRLARYIIFYRAKAYYR